MKFNKKRATLQGMTVLEELNMSKEEQEIIIEIPAGGDEAYLYSTWPGLAGGSEKRAAETTISKEQINLLNLGESLQDSMQADLFKAEREKLGPAKEEMEYGPALLPEEASVLIRRQGGNPYWLEIETELPEWQEKLRSHPQAILRRERKLGQCTSMVYMIPAVALHIEI